MNLVDSLIILAILMGAILGFKRGFIKQTVMSVGIIVVIVLAFLFKNPVSIFLYEHLPFFNFGGVFTGLTSLNILLYEVIAFLIVLSLLMVVFRVLIMVTGLIEKGLNFTIILGIPSKLLGAVMGALEAYVYVFVLLFVFSLPVFNIKVVHESDYATKVLSSTPLLGSIANRTVETFTEVYTLSKSYNETDRKLINRDMLEIMLKNKVVSVNSVEKLFEDGKLDIPNITDLINKYKGV